MKKIIIAVIGLLVLGGGGFGAYMFLNKPAEKVEVAEVEVEEEVHKKSSKVYVELEPIFVPVINHRGVSRMVSMVVALEVKNANEASRARSLSPKLKSYILKDMYGVFDHEAKSGNVHIKTSLLKKRLMKVSSRILGPENVLGVKIQAVTQRKV